MRAAPAIAHHLAREGAGMLAPADDDIGSQTGGLRSRFFSSLGYRDNRVFWIGTGLSSVAQAAFLVSAGWLAFDRSGSSAVGAVTFATMIPFLIATPIGGLLADRIDRRQIILGAQMLQGLLALALAAQTLLWRVPLPELIVLVFMSGIARTIELPTVGAALPGLVPRAELLNTMSLNSLATLGSRFAGPALAAPLLAFSGAGAAFLGIAALYLPALWFTRRVPPLRPGALATLPILEQIREGGRYIWERGALRLLLGIVVLHCALTMSFDSILPLFAKDNLNGSGAIYSSLVAAVGLGAIGGTLYLAGLRSRGRRGMLLLASGVASGLATALMAVSGVWVVALGAMFLVGASQALFMALSTTMVQEVTPDGLRGRVTGIFLMSAGGIMSFSNLANGYLSDRVGASRVLGLPGFVFVALLLGITVAQPTLRRVYRQGRLPREAALVEASV